MNSSSTCRCRADSQCLYHQKCGAHPLQPSDAHLGFENSPLQFQTLPVPQQVPSSTFDPPSFPLPGLGQQQYFYRQQSPADLYLGRETTYRPPLFQFTNHLPFADELVTNYPNQAGVSLLMASSDFSEVSGTYTEDGLFVPSYHEDLLPEELYRVSTGDSVIDGESVLGDFGRTYHGYKEGKYLLPNDALEQDRLDFQHAGISILLGGRLHFAPIQNPKHVADIATGTGIWAIEFAERFPNCQIIGTDLSNIQPGNAPPNITFLKDDAEGEWLYPQKFDYVHFRLVFTCFDNPKKVMQEAFNSMNPGAWIEFHDGDAGNVLSPDGDISHLAFPRLFRTMVSGTKILVGRDIGVVPYYKEWMEQVGFVNVREHKIRSPWSPWSKDPKENLVGRYMQRNCLDGALLATWKMLTAAGLSTEEAKQLIEQAKQEVLDINNRFYIIFYVVYGQKP
ncbi:S-adenosyl-L-methionine-dependent methyltransferase [Xylariales sp. PMI_506]|nr:S-adenosyl-L-methionine-dependent methyltransferase [Xylariales sp. PMI_506]